MFPPEELNYGNQLECSKEVNAVMLQRTSELLTSHGGTLLHFNSSAGSAHENHFFNRLQQSW